jgi:hypothetical protein
MLPEEDRPPAWLADYGSIEADINAMEDFAAGLDKEVREGYEPHLQLVTTSMMTELPHAPKYSELNSFLDAHYKVQMATFSNTFNFRAGTGQMADAAKTISDQYRGSDAFSQTRVKDVDSAFSKTGNQLAETNVTEAP